MRRLQTTRRHVPLDVADEYLAAWADVRRQVEKAGGNAWIFRAAAHVDQFIEFIEWNDGADAPSATSDVEAAAAELDAFAAPGAAEEWEEPE